MPLSFSLSTNVQHIKHNKYFYETRNYILFSFRKLLNICFSTTIMYLKNKCTPSDITGKLAEHILCFKLLFVRLHMANQ